MRNSISEFIDYSEDEKTQIWTMCKFVFDANVLLNLYRYSAKTRNALQDAISRVNERLWIPYHVAWEFMKNRLEVIHKSEARYKNLDKEISKFIETCKQELGLRDSDSEFKELKDFLKKWSNRHRRKNLAISKVPPSEDDDKILKFILDSFENKIGEPYTQEKYIEMRNEAKKRYADKIPPGYEDSSKTDDGLLGNIYGDYIIWTQILNYASSCNTDIAFVTADTKEDWWNIVHGKTIGPRHELKKEFSAQTGRRLLFYTPESFITFSTQRSGRTVDEATLTELSEFNSSSSVDVNAFAKPYSESSLRNAYLKSRADSDQKFKRAKRRVNVDRMSSEDSDSRNDRHSRIISDDETFQLLSAYRLLNDLLDNNNE